MAAYTVPVSCHGPVGPSLAPERLAGSRCFRRDSTYFSLNIMPFLTTPLLVCIGVCILQKAVLHDHFFSGAGSLNDGAAALGLHMPQLRPVQRIPIQKPWVSPTCERC